MVYAELSLIQLNDRKPKLITKLLAPLLRLDLSLFNEDDEIYAVVNDRWAVIFYFGGLGNTFRSVNSDSSILKREIEFLLGGKDRISHPSSNCVPRDKVWGTFLTFFEIGKKPETIEWEKDDVE